MNHERFSTESGAELERTPMSRQAARRTGEKTLSASEQDALQNRLSGEQKTAKPNTYSTILKMSDFAVVIDAGKLRRDEEYVRNSESRFQEQAATKHLDDPDWDPDWSPERITETKIFEKLFIKGLQAGRWLGNTVNTAEHPTFGTRTYEATRYDDILHRIDAFTTLKLAEPFETSIGTTVKNLPLGFDVTTDGRRQIIEDKLTRQYNNSAQLPFGFSQVDYYTNGALKTSLAIIPRYVIGVSSDDVSGIRKRLRSGKPVNMLSPKNLETRFKVLAEIRAQNELYDAMLPDDAYDSEDSQIRRAVSYIETADDKLKTALQACAQEMVKQKVLPAEIMAKIQEKPSRQRQIIEEYLISRGHDEHQELGRERCRAQGEIYDAAADDADDTFAQIMLCTRRLSEAARQGKMDAYRTVMAHNKSIEIPG